ncbi:MAG TPA: ATP-binding protein, partial [Longimicrobiales bacterium]|nr:ATP-binding protein [Longimicrobiales bacterium]
RVQYQMQDVKLTDALADLERLIAPQIVSKELVFACRPCIETVTVHADPDKLQQIMLNLLTNAIKFTPSGGTVLVETEVTGEQVSIHVQDTGIGIPEDRLQAVFEPFFQVDRAHNRPAEGIGLGLAISRDLARGMGGELSAESAIGRGSVFSLSLRRGAPAQLEPARERDSAIA